MKSLTVELRGELVQLLPERALLRERSGTLYVADLHVGKAAAFRSERLAIPRGTTAGTLERLTRALQRSGAERLVILGDFFHSRAGLHADTVAELHRWRATLPQLPIVLMRGNHDRHAGDPEPALEIACHDAPFDDDGWLLRHHPGADNDGFWLAGHVHPAVALVGPARQSLLLLCFHLQAHGMVLPSFGEFTGKGVIEPERGDRVFVVAEDEVVEV
jgi:uncharacterized protein